MLDIIALYGYRHIMSSQTTFTPVPRQSSRHDGWSADTQICFIEALADYGSVRAAAEKAGKAAGSAYRLRHSAGADSFAAAWDDALKIGMMHLQDIAMERAINGVAVPKFYKGEIVGETRWHDNRLLMFMLRHTNRQIFGPHADEEDWAARTTAAEIASEQKRLELLARAETLLEVIEDALAADAGETSLVEPERRLLHSKQEGLERLIAQLRHVDTIRAGEAHFDQLLADGRLTAANVRAFKKRLHAQAP
ncbi:MAG: hypothetical protein RIS52_327 [Pseudomonadota bacterium]